MFLFNCSQDLTGSLTNLSGLPIQGTEDGSEYVCKYKGRAEMNTYQTLIFIDQVTLTDKL